MNTEYRVELDAYSGPLDLLLFLVKRHEIDLNDIPIARLTDQYLQHLEMLKQIDVNLAGEFLVMASTLLEIKSALLLPPVTPEAAAGDPATGDAGSASGGASGGALNPADPRYELVQQLLAYKRIKDAANELQDRQAQWESRFPHLPAALMPTESNSGDPADDAAAIAALNEIDLEDVSILDLCDAFARILASVGQGPLRHEVVYDDTPIALHAEDILDRLQRETPKPGPSGPAPSLTLEEIFVGRTSRSELIGLFLATLELVRQRRVRVVQDSRGPIRIELRPANEPVEADNATAEEAATKWRNPATGEIDYDWPSEEARKAAERRATLRASRAVKGNFRGFGKSDEEIIDVDGDSTAAPADHDDAPLADDDLEVDDQPTVDENTEP